MSQSNSYYHHNNSAISKVIISLMLVFLGVLLIWLHLIFSPYSYTVTISPHLNNLNQHLQKPLLASQIFRSTVTARENNLGIVTIRFYIERQKVRNTIVFRIKEKGASKWYYENTFDTRQFYTLPFYPFGFPPISNSKDKVYEFELETLDGIEKNSIYISSVRPNLVLSYQYSKDELMSDYKLFFLYTIHKIKNAVLYMDMGFAIFVYFIPLFFYVLWHIKLKDFFHIFKSNNHREIQIGLYSKVVNIKVSYIFHVVLLIVTIGDIVYIKTYYDLVVIVLFLMWILITKLNDIKSAYYYLLAIILLCTTAIISTFSTIVAGKSAVWVLMFLILAVAIDICEIIKTRRVKSKIYEK